MGEIVVFPEQFSFDVRVQKNNPKRRLTIKNLGINACKVTITLPESDAFTITDSKGKAISEKTTFNMSAESSYCLFVQKKASVGIVPEDSLSVTGGKKPYRIALKPAVSLVSMQELESVASRKDDASVQSIDDGGSIDFTADDFDPGSKEPEPPESAKKRVSRLPAPTKRATKPKSPETPKAAPPPPETKSHKPNEPDLSFDEQDFDDKPKKPVKDELEFTASDFQINPPAPAPSPAPAPAPVPAPAKIQESPTVKKSGIPGRARKNPHLPPEADVLEQSLHVKFSFKDDDFVKGSTKSQPVNWYSEDAFEGVVEPEFSFELMMTGDQEDPVFCIDGDYYDSSGRLLTVQQGKGKVIYVTEDGWAPGDEY